MKNVHSLDRATFDALCRDLEEIAEGYGYAYGIITAQISLETGNGTKIIDNNLFNIKATGSWLESKTYVEVITTEYENGIPRKQSAKFRKYNSYEESLMDYISLIGRLSIYKEAWINRNNPYVYFNALYSGGYATDPIYAVKLREKYEAIV